MQRSLAASPWIRVELAESFAWSADEPGLYNVPAGAGYLRCFFEAGGYDWLVGARCLGMFLQGTRPLLLTND